MKNKARAFLLVVFIGLNIDVINANATTDESCFKLDSSQTIVEYVCNDRAI